jgi:hypothetical protein
LKTEFNSKCDVYAFAIVMWEMVNGNVKPYSFLKESNQTVYSFVIEKGRPPLDEKIPSEIRKVKKKKKF